MKHTVHTSRDAFALQQVLHQHKVSYTLNYIYKDGQRDSMEYWQFEIADVNRVFNAVITNLYKSANP